MINQIPFVIPPVSSLNKIKSIKRSRLEFFKSDRSSDREEEENHQVLRSNAIVFAIKNFQPAHVIAPGIFQIRQVIRPGGGEC
jgi:hypothetical protein